MEFHQVLLVLAILTVAFLYSSVGHAGASGYIAVMALAGFSAASIKPSALVLNVLVASIGSFQFWHAGHFHWRHFWPFAVTSVPAAFLGGYLQLPEGFFRPLVGLVLYFSAAWLCYRRTDPLEVKPPAYPVALGSGAGIGFLAGLTGTGGGIFLTPLILLRKWAFTRNAAAVSALFILVNSISGLLGHLRGGRGIPSIAWPLAIAAVVGGIAGSYSGSKLFPVRVVRLMLAAVLVVAGSKLIFA